MFRVFTEVIKGKIKLDPTRDGNVFIFTSLFELLVKRERFVHAAEIGFSRHTSLQYILGKKVMNRILTDNYITYFFKYYLYLLLFSLVA